MGMTDLRPRHLYLIAAVVLVIKLAYILEYCDLPFMMAPLFDSSVYLHDARAVLRGHLGLPLFSRSPLYEYFLALLGGGLRPVLPIGVQLGLGCVNLVLIYRLGTRLFSRLAGMVSASLYLGYGSLLFYESKLLPETLAMTLVVWGMWLYLSPAFLRGDLRRALLCGAVLALGAATQRHLMVSAPLFAVFALVPMGPGDPAAHDRRTRARRGVTCLLATCLVLCAQGLLTWASPAPGWSPDPAPRALLDLAGRAAPTVALTAAALRAAPAAAALGAAPAAAALGAAPATAPAAAPALATAPAWALAAAAGRVAAVLMDIEGNSHMYSYYGERSDLIMLRALPVSFGVILLLGGVGAALLFRRSGGLSVLPFLPLVLGPLFLAVFPTFGDAGGARRLTMAVPLILLSGLSAEVLLRGPFGRKKALFSVLVGISCAAFFLRTATYEMRDPAAYELIVATSAARAGEFEQALERVERARRIAPDNPALERAIRDVVGLIQKRRH